MLAVLFPLGWGAESSSTLRRNLTGEVAEWLKALAC